MAREVHKFGVTVPAGTLKTAPLVSNLTMPPRVITAVTIVIPPGTRGLVGFALGAAGVPFIPYQPGQFFVTDDEKITWPLEEQMTSGAWQAFTYNTGQYAHTLEFRFLVMLPVDVGGSTSVLLPSTSLDSSAGGPPATLDNPPAPPPGVPVAIPALPPSPGTTRTDPAPGVAAITPPVRTRPMAPAPTLATVGFRPL
jgi:hypothetical protein